MAFDDEIEAFRAYLGLFGERGDAAHRHLRHDRGGASDRGGGPAARRPCASTAATSAALADRCARCSTPVDFRATRIIVSGDLDEHRIAALVADGRRSTRSASARRSAPSATRRARRRLQARGNRARRRDHADGEAQRGQAHVSRPQAGVASRESGTRLRDVIGLERRNDTGRTAAAVVRDAAGTAAARRRTGDARCRAASARAALASCRVGSDVHATVHEQYPWRSAPRSTALARSSACTS